MDILIGISFFIVYLLAFTIGLKHGKQLNQGVMPKINLNPVKAITESVEQRKRNEMEKKTEEEFIDAMSYTKEAALEAIKKER